MRYRASLLILLAAVLMRPDAAFGHEVRASVTGEGWSYLSKNLPDLVPRRIQPGDLKKDLPGCFALRQHDTTVDISDLETDVSFPRPGIMRLELELAAVMEGTATVENFYACLGSQSCSDRVTIDRAQLAVELAFETNGNEVIATVADVHLAIDDDDINFDLCDGVFGAMFDAVESGLRNIAFSYLLDFAEDLARDKLAVVVEEMVAEYSTIELDAFGTQIEARLMELLAAPDSGLSSSIDVDLIGGEPHACVAAGDTGEPESVEGAAPAVSPEAHLALALNLGLLNDALYQIWSQGLTCIDQNTVAALGLDVDFHHLDEELSKVLPGVPAGTHFDVEAAMLVPPSISGRDGEGLGLAIAIPDLAVRFTGHYPTGDIGTLTVDVGFEAAARVRIDPRSGAVLLAPGEVTLSKLELGGDIGDASGFDQAVIQRTLETMIIPGVLGELGEIPVSGRVFGASTPGNEPFPGASRVFALVHQVSSNAAFLAAELRFFVAPADDRRPPRTEILERPGAITSLAQARFLVTGSDTEIPAELLRYRVEIDGEMVSEDFLGEVRIGEPGVTATHEVEIRAVDLAGNIDPLRQPMTVTVDGIFPSVFVHGERVRAGSTTTLEFQASDDLTGTPSLRVDVYRLADPTNPLTAEIVETVGLEAGATTADIEVGSGTYRLEVVATDEAGNEGSASILLRSQGGCSTSGGASGPLGAAVLGLMALLSIRRRRARV